MSGFRDGRLAALKARIAAIEIGGRSGFGSLPFGAPDIDACLPGGGLPLGQWHEFAGVGMEVETGACTAAFAALAAAPLARRGEAVWVLRRDDLFAPGLVGLGFPAERLIQVCARDEDEALAVTEDALSTLGVAAVFAEVEGVDLTAGRRLQLAAEAGGATGLCLIPEGMGSPAAETRWHCAPVFDARTDAQARPDSTLQCWRLIKNKEGTLGAWHVRWDATARRLVVVSPVGQRPGSAGAPD